MTKNIEHLPVMQLETGTVLPKDSRRFEFGRLDRMVTYQGITRQTEWIAPVIGRSQSGGIYFYTKEGERPDGSAILVVGEIEPKDLISYEPYSMVSK